MMTFPPRATESVHAPRVNAYCRHLVFAIFALATARSAADEYFKIQVLDSQTGRGIPLVELSPQGGATIVTDGGLLTLSGAITISATSARNLYFQGVGNGLARGAISDNSGNPAGSINIAKEGTGTWTLSGANTYTGTTTVTGGKLLVNSTRLSAVDKAPDLVHRRSTADR
jgi:autotransporter-associated beta strand protein